MAEEEAGEREWRLVGMPRDARGPLEPTTVCSASAASLHFRASPHNGPARRLAADGFAPAAPASERSERSHANEPRGALT